MTSPEGHFTGPDDAYHDSAFRQVQMLPQWRLMLHDDEVHDEAYVINVLAALTPLSPAAATRRVIDVHRHGMTQVLTCHRERAEFYCVQLSKRNLIVTIERAE
jgi:ATP-dependent Clp protease adapter protein ClpS